MALFSSALVWTCSFPNPDQFWFHSQQFLPSEEYYPNRGPWQVTFEGSYGPDCSKPFKTLLPCTQSTHLVLARSNPFPVLAAPSKLAAPLSSEFLLALLGFFCSQAHQTTSPMLPSSCSHIDPDSMQVLWLMVCPYLLKFWGSWGYLVT